MALTVKYSPHFKKWIVYQDGVAKGYFNTKQEARDDLHQQKEHTARKRKFESSKPVFNKETIYK